MPSEIKKTNHRWSYRRRSATKKNFPRELYRRNTSIRIFNDNHRRKVRRRRERRRRNRGREYCRQSGYVIIYRLLPMELPTECFRQYTYRWVYRWLCDVTVRRSRFESLDHSVCKTIWKKSMSSHRCTFQKNYIIRWRYSQYIADRISPSVYTDRISDIIIFVGTNYWRKRSVGFRRFSGSVLFLKKNIRTNWQDV